MKKLILIAFALTAVIFAAGLGGLWLFGHREGGNHAGASIEIYRPAAAIWPYLAEPDQVKRWNSGIVEITRESGTGTEVGARSRVEARGRPGEKPVIMEHTYTAVEPNKRLAFKLTANLDGMGFTQRVEQRLDEKSVATMLTVNAEVEFKGFVAELLSPLIIASAAEKTRQDLQTLKALVEKEVPAGTPVPAAQAPALDPVAEPTPAPAAETAEAAAVPVEPTPTPAPAEAAAAPEPQPAAEVEPAAADTEAAAVPANAVAEPEPQTEAAEKEAADSAPAPSEATPAETAAPAP